MKLIMFIFLSMLCILTNVRALACVNISAERLQSLSSEKRVDVVVRCMSDADFARRSLDIELADKFDMRLCKWGYTERCPGERAVDDPGNTQGQMCAPAGATCNFGTVTCCGHCYQQLSYGVCVN